MMVGEPRAITVPHIEDKQVVSCRPAEEGQNQSLTRTFRKGWVCCDLDFVPCDETHLDL